MTVVVVREHGSTRCLKLGMHVESPAIDAVDVACDRAARLESSYEAVDRKVACLIEIVGRLVAQASGDDAEKMLELSGLQYSFEVVTDPAILEQIL